MSIDFSHVVVISMRYSLQVLIKNSRCVPSNQAFPVVHSKGCKDSISRQDTVDVCMQKIYSLHLTLLG
jgi:hypothetical protein